MPDITWVVNLIVNNLLTYVFGNILLAGIFFIIIMNIIMFKFLEGSALIIMNFILFIGIGFILLPSDIAVGVLMISGGFVGWVLYGLSGR